MANYEFGPFHYDPEQRLLFREDEVVTLAPKAIDTLHILIERRGRVVAKNDLMKLLWPDTTVEEIGLARNISILRKAIEDDAGTTSYIETVPRRGYRFAAEAPRAAPTVASRPKRHIPRWTLVAALLVLCLGVVYWQFYVPSKYLAHKPGMAGIAVVPFESLSPGSDGATFANGMTDSLVADLSNVSGIEVLSPSTVRRHQRFGVSMGLMGRLLGLDALVEGSVQAAGNQLKVTARLVDVHTGKVIWAENYDRVSEPGMAETDVAREVAARIGDRLAPGSRKSQ
jgi:DNA-binding winged helix-turn-helix (wHTH) protein/TolB-like protein